VSISFLMTTLIVVATPGTGVLYTLSAAFSQGRKASVIAALGCTLGSVPHMLATLTGLAAVLHASALAFQVVKYLGVAFLLYLAWTTLRKENAIPVTARRSAPVSPMRTITTAVLINLLNPKLTLFFLAFLPQFVSPGEPNPVLRMLELSAVFMLVSLVVFTAYGVFAAAVRDRVISRPRVMAWLRRIFAGSFIALSADLALK